MGVVGRKLILYESECIIYTKHILKVWFRWQIRGKGRVESGYRNVLTIKEHHPAPPHPPDMPLRVVLEPKRCRCTGCTQWKICAPSEKWRAQFVEQQLNIYNCGCMRAAFIWYLFRGPRESVCSFVRTAIVEITIAHANEPPPRPPHTAPERDCAHRCWWRAVLLRLDRTTLMPTRPRTETLEKSFPWLNRLL